MKKFIPIIVIELLYILFAGVMSFTSPISSYTVQVDENQEGLENALNVQIMDDTYKTEELVGVIREEYSDNPTEEILFFSLPYCLNKGGYEIVVEYEANYYNDETQKRTDNVVGTLSLYSQNNQPGIKGRTLNLNDTEKTATTRIWTNSKIEDVRFKVTYKGNGTLEVKSIIIKESFSYRVMLWLFKILILIGIDLLYILLFTNYIIKDIKTKYVFFAVTGIFIFSGAIYLGNNVYYGNDINFHMGRICYLAESISNGQIPERIHQGMIYGYGYATPLFYCDVFLYIPALLYLMFLPLQTCYQIYMIGVNLITCFISYFCFKKITNSRKYGVIGCFIYVCSTYRMIDLYVRQAVGEYTAMAFLPLIIYGIYKVYSHDKSERVLFKEFIPLIVGIMGVLYSHILTLEMSAIFIVAFGLICWKKTFSKDIFIGIVKSAILMILLSLWYLWPLIRMIDKVKIGENHIMYMQTWGASFWELFGMFHTTSRCTSMGVMITCGIVLYIILNIYLTHNSEKDEVLKRRLKQIKVLFVLGIVAVFFASEYFPWDSIQDISKSVWDIVAKVNYPWRYLTIATALLVPMMVLLLQYIESKVGKKVGTILIIGIIGLGVVSESLFLTEIINDKSNAGTYTENDIVQYYLGSYEEYLLKGTDKSLLYQKNLIADEELEVKEYSNENGVWYITCANESEEEKTMTLPVLNYTGYNAYDNLTSAQLIVENGENNRLRIRVPVGYDGTIEVKYIEPYSWRVAEWISLITGLSVIGAYMLSKKNKKISIIRKG